MGAITFLSWEGDSETSIAPRRPSTEDLGGDELIDDQELPPIDGEMPTAAAWNQIVKQVVAMSKMLPAASLRVHFTGGTPAITQLACPSSLVTTPTFTVTDMGSGDTKIEWPAGTFPAQSFPPGVHLLGNPGATPKSVTVEEITNGVRVRTAAGGAGTDIDFRLDIG